MEKKTLRVAVYCRVATADQLTLKAQKEALQQYAAQLGYERPLFYLDNGYSGLNLDRPAFLKLDADIQAGHIGTVIVRNIDRIGRNTLDVMPWIDKLTKMGIELLTLDLANLGNFSCSRMEYRYMGIEKKA